MDYTQSPDAVTHAGTGHKMHSLAGAVTTEVTDKDLNSLIWSAMAILNAAGVAGVQFDPAVPGSYDRVLTSLRKLFRGNENDVWKKSADGYDRSYEEAAGASQYRGHGTTPFRWYRGDGVSIAALTDTGILSTIADAVASGDVPRWGQVQAAIGRPGHSYSLPDWIWLDKAAGVILQIGLIPAYSSTPAAVTFPTNFTTACWGVVALGDLGPINITPTQDATAAFGKSLSGVSFRTTAGSAPGGFYLAIGI